MPTAASLAEAIKGRFGVDATLVQGQGGVFDVHVNGAQIWNKQQVGRFPENAEILEKIAELGATP
ncbi:MAG: SelT/SelW/SelH family protein [Phycisphaerae bacterium]